VKTQALVLCFLLLVPALRAATENDNDEAVIIDPDPEDFVDVDLTNPFFPLVPGTTLVYTGSIDNVPARTEFTVTRGTKVIQGITTTVVDEKDFENGVKTEETRDWYAIDNDGNVWYFGESTVQVDPNGKVTGTTGSWEAGVNRGEDRAIIRSLHTTVSVPVGIFTGCLKTKEFSRLDPGVFEQKYYGRGIGLLKSSISVGGNEHFVLSQILHN
jgi:hypothetical protein